MKVLFANIPNVIYKNGTIYTGPNSGSRWPWTMPGPSFHGYAPYPFDMAYAVSWLRSHQIDAHLYDGVARCHSNMDLVRTAIYDIRPSIVVFDVSTPVFDLTNEIALWTKNTIQSKIVYFGQHIRSFANECKQLPFVDHCIKGELEIPILDIINNYPGGEGIYESQFVKQINTLPNGDNWLPYRDTSSLGSYYDPSMQTARTQLQLSCSRSCPFSCTYCNVSTYAEKVSYRARSPEMVIDELIQMKSVLGNSLGSIFFDDDTWNLGDKRILNICAGLKKIGLPWTMMGRIDTSTLDVYDAMVDSGCCGMRFGIESFNQKLLDNTKKKLDAKVTYNNIKYLLTHFRGLEFHFTTMKNLPGSVPNDWKQDQAILAELINLGKSNNHTVHYQNSDCIPFPGTELWDNLIQLGHSDKLKDFKLYDGHPDNDAKLAKSIGWLGK